MLDDIHDTVGLIKLQVEDSILKAWEALSGYKFWMFGYHAARFINYNRLLPPNEKVQPNPFIELVKIARSKID